MSPLLIVALITIIINGPNHSHYYMYECYNHEDIHHIAIFLCFFSLFDILGFLGEAIYFSNKKQGFIVYSIAK